MADSLQLIRKASATCHGLRFDTNLYKCISCTYSLKLAASECASSNIIKRLAYQENCFNAIICIDGVACLR